MSVKGMYKRDPSDPLKIPSDVIVFYCPICKEPIDPYENKGGNLYCCPACSTWFSMESVGHKEVKE